MITYRALIFASLVATLTFNTVSSAFDATDAERREYQKQIETCTEELKAKPDRADLLEKRAELYTCLKDFDKGLADINQAVKLEPRNPKFYFVRITVEADMQSYDNALRDADECLKLQPDDVRYLGAKAMVLGLLGRHKESLTVINRCIELKPTAEEYEIQSHTLFRLNKYREAMEAANHVLQLDPSYPRIKDFRKEIFAADPGILNVTGTR